MGAVGVGAPKTLLRLAALTIAHLRPCIERFRPMAKLSSLKAEDRVSFLDVQEKQLCTGDMKVTT